MVKKAAFTRVDDIQGLIPPEWLYEDYVSREFSGILDLDVLKMAQAYRHNVLVYGPTGPGKTSMVLAYAARERMPFFSIPCNGAMEPRHFFGAVVPVPPDQAEVVAGGVSFRWQDGPVTVLVRNGGVLLLNEVNFLHPRISAVLHPLLDKRREITLMEHDGEIIKAHSNLLVVADYNPGYEGTRPLNAAFKNRFALKLEFDYLRDVEKQLVQHSALLDLAAKLRKSHADGDIVTPISTNMLMEFEDFAAAAGFEFATSNFLAAFTVEERAAVKMAFDMLSDKIKAQFGEQDKNLAPDVEAEMKAKSKTSRAKAPTV